MIGENSVLAEEKYHLHSEMAENRPHQLFSSENVSEAGMCVVFWGREPLKTTREQLHSIARHKAVNWRIKKQRMHLNFFQKKCAIYGIRTDMTDYPIANNEDVKCNFKK